MPFMHSDALNGELSHGENRDLLVCGAADLSCHERKEGAYGMLCAAVSCGYEGQSAVYGVTEMMMLGFSRDQRIRACVYGGVDLVPTAAAQYGNLGNGTSSVDKRNGGSVQALLTKDSQILGGYGR